MTRTDRWRSIGFAMCSTLLPACGSSSSEEPPGSPDAIADSVTTETSDAGGSDVVVSDSDASETTSPVKCTTINDCYGATPRCDTALGVCVGCATDGDCRGGLRCYKTTGECRDCVTDADCSDPTPYCDFASSRQCTAKCTKDADCPGPTGSMPAHCDTTAGVCYDCLKGSHCGGGFCELVTHSCVGCLVDTDCPTASPKCGPSYECTPKCTSDAECGGLKCDPASSLCVECVTNKHCPGGICQVDHTCG